MQITVFSTKPYDEDFLQRVNADYKFTLNFQTSALSASTAILAHNSQAVCLFVNDKADAAAIAALAEQGVQLIALRCAGFNNVDLKACAQHGIKVVRVPAYSPHAVAEHACALMLALNRKINRAASRTREGDFSLHGLMGFDMYGKTAGIVGTGKIARALISILKGFGMQVLAYDIYPDAAYAAQAGISYVSFDELCAKADIISLHCPLTDATRHIINASSIAKMKHGVMLINTGRGQLICTKDLVAGLKTGQIGYAGLDVYEEEAKYFYSDESDAVMTDDVLARLLTFNNVIVTSHQGFFTQEALTNIAKTTLQNVQDFVDGKALVNEVVATA